MVSEKIFSGFSHYKPLVDNDAPWTWPITVPGTRLAGFMKGITKHCYTKNIEAQGLMVSEKKIFLCFPNYNPIGAIRRHGNQSSNPIWPKTLCNLSPTPMMLQIKFGFYWPSGFREDV